METLHTLALALASALLTSCLGMHNSLPSTVTDPAVIETYNKAKAGNADALYEIGMMYKEGLNGFPKSSGRSYSVILDAAYSRPPSAAACYELFLDDLQTYNKSPLTMKSYKESADRWLEVACALKEPRALAYMQAEKEKKAQEDARLAGERAREAEAEAARERYLEENFYKCPRCNGTGGRYKEVPNYVQRLNRNGMYEDKQEGYKMEWKECEDCKMSREPGYIPRGSEGRKRSSSASWETHAKIRSLFR